VVYSAARRRAYILTARASLNERRRRRVLERSLRRVQTRAVTGEEGVGVAGEDGVSRSVGQTAQRAIKKRPCLDVALVKGLAERVALLVLPLPQLARRPVGWEVGEDLAQPEVKDARGRAGPLPSAAGDVRLAIALGCSLSAGSRVLLDRQLVLNGPHQCRDVASPPRIPWRGGGGVSRITSRARAERAATRGPPCVAVANRMRPRAVRIDWVEAGAKEMFQPQRVIRPAVAEDEVPESVHALKALVDEPPGHKGWHAHAAVSVMLSILLAKPRLADSAASGGARMGDCRRATWEVHRVLVEAHAHAVVRECLAPSPLAAAPPALLSVHADRGAGLKACSVRPTVPAASEAERVCLVEQHRREVSCVGRRPVCRDISRLRRLCVGGARAFVTRCYGAAVSRCQISPPSGPSPHPQAPPLSPVESG